VSALVGRRRDCCWSTTTTWRCSRFVRIRSPADRARGAGALAARRCPDGGLMQVWDLSRPAGLARPGPVGPCGLGVVAQRSGRTGHEPWLTVVVQAADLWSADGRADELLARSPTCGDDWPAGSAGTGGWRRAARPAEMTACGGGSHAVTEQTSRAGLGGRGRRPALGVLERRGRGLGARRSRASPPCWRWTRTRILGARVHGALRLSVRGPARTVPGKAADRPSVPAGALDAVGKAFWQHLAGRPAPR